MIGLFGKQWWKLPFQNGPYTYVRSPLPSPGAENSTFLSLGLPEQSPIAGALPNHRSFLVSQPAGITGQFIGLQGYGGIPNASGWQNYPLVNTTPEMPLQAMQFPG